MKPAPPFSKAEIRQTNKQDSTTVQDRSQRIQPQRTMHSTTQVRSTFSSLRAPSTIDLANEELSGFDSERSVAEMRRKGGSLQVTITDSIMKKSTATENLELLWGEVRDYSVVPHFLGVAKGNDTSDLVFHSRTETLDGSVNNSGALTVVASAFGLERGEGYYLRVATSCDDRVRAPPINVFKDFLHLAPGDLIGATGKKIRGDFGTVANTFNLKVLCIRGAKLVTKRWANDRALRLSGIWRILMSHLRY
jgi:hypothetical protein